MSEIIDIIFATNAPEFTAESRRIERAIAGIEQRSDAMANELVDDSRKIEKSGERVDSMYKQISSTLLKLGGTVAVATLAKQLYDFAKAFDLSMKEVATISETVAYNMESFTRQVLELGTRVPIAADAAGKALYQIVSAGYDGAAGMNLLEVSAKSAIAGMTDTTTAADAITTSLNAYKKSAEEAANVSDLLFMTAKLGKTTFGQLGQSISQAAPIAAAYGVELEQVLAAVATLTKSGTPTAQAMTQIRSAIISVSKYLGDGAFEAMTFQDALSLVAERANGSEDALRGMITETEAISGVLGLTGINARMAASDLTAMGGAAGETEKAFSLMVDQADAQLTILKNNMLKKFHEMGTSALDSVTAISTALNGTFETGAMDDVIATMGVLIATLGAYKAALIITNAVHSVGNNIRYAMELAELQKLLPVKEASKNVDIQTAVTSGRLTQVKAEQIIAIRAEIQERLKAMQIAATEAKFELARAIQTRQNSLQRIILAKQNVGLAQSQMNIALKSGNIDEIAAAKNAARTAKIELHSAAVAKNTALQALGVAQDKAKTTAMAAETFQQGINTAATNAGVKAKNLMTFATGKLTKAFHSLKLAFSSNPFGLILTGITLTITAMSLFSGKAKTTQDVIADLNTASDQYDKTVKTLNGDISRYDELQQKAKENTGLTKDEHIELNTIMEAMLTTVPNLKGEFDEYGKALSVNIEAVKSYSKKHKEAYKDVLQANIQTAEQEKKVLENKLETQRKIFQEGRKLTFEEVVDGQLGETTVYKKIDKYVKASAEEIQQARTEWSSLNTELIEISTSIINSKNVLDRVNDNLKDGNESKTTPAAPENYGTNYKAAKQAWEIAKKELTKIEKDKDSFTQKQYDDAKKRLTDSETAFNAIGGQTKVSIKEDKSQSDKFKNDQSKIEAERTLKDALVNVMFETEQAIINAQQSGYEREMAQINLNYRKKQTTIELWEREQRQIVIDAQKALFVANGGKEADFKANYNDADLIPINKAYNAKSTANNTERVDAEKMILTELRQQWQDWGDEYQQIEDKLTEIAERAVKSRADIAATVASGQLTKEQGVAATETVDKGEQEAVIDLTAAKMKLSAEWIQVFQDLQGMSREQVRVLIDEINAQLSNSKLSAADSSALLEQLNKAKEYSITLNPFASLIDGINDVRTATQKLEQATIKLNAAKSNNASKQELVAATKEKIAAEKAVAVAKQQRNDSTSKSIGAAAGAASATSDLLKNFGVESPAVDGVVNSLSALGEINFSNPMSIITGGLKAVSSLLNGIFGEMDAVREQKIQEIQKQIDELEKSYDRLSITIEKAYSTNASSMIEQQNMMLEQQSRLISQQIEEEESKKNDDQGKVESYKQAQEDIKKQIEENEIKARDAIFGSDIKSAINEFANAYTGAWASGEDRAIAQKDVVKKMVKGIVQEMIKSDIAKQVEQMRDKIASFMSDDLLSDDELSQIDSMGDQIGEIMERRGKIYDKILKTDTVNENSLSGAIKGTIATEASVSQLAGIMNRDSDNIYAISTKLDLGFQSVAQAARYAKEIAANTLRTADNTEKIAETNKKLDTIIKNTSSDHGTLK